MYAVGLRHDAQGSRKTRGRPEEHVSYGQEKTQPGLDYLSLDRSAVSLSGGESQRIRLATQIGSQLVNVLYILDEPSIGLHQRPEQLLPTTEPER